MTLDHIVARMALDAVVAFDSTVAFDTTLVALLASSFMMWRSEHIWNFSYLTTPFQLFYRMGWDCDYKL
jgi:glycopeptide antibiotics resistance protein